MTGRFRAAPFFPDHSGGRPQTGFDEHGVLLFLFGRELASNAGSAPGSSATQIFSKAASLRGGNYEVF